MTDKKTVRLVFLAIVSTALIFWAVFNMSVVWGWITQIARLLAPFFGGFCVAFVLNIPMKAYERLFDKSKYFRETENGFKVKRILSLVLSITTLTVVIGLVFFIVLPEFIGTIETIWKSIPRFVTDSQTYIIELFEKFPSVAEGIKNIKINWESIQESVISFTKTGVWGVSGVIGSLFNGVTTSVISVIFSVYILMQKEQFKSGAKIVVCAVLGKKRAYSFLELCKRSSIIFSSFISGQFIEAVIEGLVFFVVLSIFRFPSSAVIGVIVGFTALIPIVGTFIGAIMAALLICAFDPVKAFWFLVLFVVLQQITNNIIYPRVVGSSIGLPGVWVLAAVTIGGGLFGVFGMLFMVPVCAIIYSILKEKLYENGTGDSGIKKES